MKIAIATRSRNAELYAMASCFWPEDIPLHRVTDMNHWMDAIHYLHHILNIDADYVINCDEDCFVFHWPTVERMIATMEKEGTAYAGMPDITGNCSHRNNAAFVHNPFFTVFRPKAVQERLLATVDYANRVLLNTNWPQCAHHEPFNNFYAALIQAPKMKGPLNFHGVDHRDGISTELVHHNTPFALHSWYSREFEGSHHKRILNLYHEARSRCTLP